MKTIPVWVVSVGLVFGPTLAARPGASQGVVARVWPDSVAVAHGVMVRYRLENASSSQQPARALIVETRVALQRLAAPPSSLDWVAVGQPGDSLALWSAVSPAQDVAPGATRKGLVLAAVSGLPGIVRFWVQGRSAGAVAAGGEGMTVGVVPVTDSSPNALMTRLDSLQVQVCTLQWVTDRGDCNSLVHKLTNALEQLSSGNTQGAAQMLEAFLRQLNARHSKEAWASVTDDAYWLLEPNAEFVMARLK